MSGWLFLAMGALVSASDFLIGLYMSRLGPDGPTLYAHGKTLSTGAANRIGRLLMLLAPLLFLVFAALSFGLLPVDAIDPIRLGAS
jgi:hypothetical protein